MRFAATIEIKRLWTHRLSGLARRAGADLPEPQTP